MACLTRFFDVARRLIFKNKSWRRKICWYNGQYGCLTAYLTVFSSELTPMFCVYCASLRSAHLESNSLYLSIFTIWQFSTYRSLKILHYYLISDYPKKMDINCWPELAVNYGVNFESFLQQKLFSDVTLIARDRNGLDIKFPVHRFVLASALPYVCLFMLEQKFIVLFNQKDCF